MRSKKTVSRSTVGGKDTIMRQKPKIKNTKALAKVTDIVLIENGQPYTTSRIVAQCFGKEHFHVLRDVKRLMDDDTQNPEVWASKTGLPESTLVLKTTGQNLMSPLHFEEILYLDSRGKWQPEYRMDVEAFENLAVNFTGAPARFWKRKFVRAFNLLLKKCAIQEAQKHNPEWQLARGRGKVVRRAWGVTVERFVKYCEAGGSERPENYYHLITNAEYRCLFIVMKGEMKKLRDRLSTDQLQDLAFAERVAERALIAGMDAGMEYHDIYKLAKRKLDELEAVLGQKSLPGEGTHALPGIEPLDLTG